MKGREMEKKAGEAQRKGGRKTKKENKRKGERKWKGGEINPNKIYGNMRLPRIEQDNEDKSNMGNHYKDT